MIDEIKEETVVKVLSVTPKVAPAKRVQVANPVTFGAPDGTKRKPAKSDKVGRNDPCPCGSGKKYKKCCGANKGEE